MIGANSLNYIQLAANIVYLTVAGYGFYRLIMRAIGHMIDERVHPRLEDVSTKLLEHMDAEVGERRSMSKSLKETRKKVSEVKGVLDDRTVLFDKINETLNDTQNVLNAHMQRDEEVLEVSRHALQVGQKELLDKIDGQTAELSGTFAEHAESDEARFDRIERKLDKRK